MTKIPEYDRIVDVFYDLVRVDEIKAKRLRMSPQQVQLHFQSRFLTVLQQNRLFDNTIRQTLKPLLKQVAGSDRSLHFSQVPDSEYRSQLLAFVGKQLRCTVNGKPAPWLVPAIHAYVLTGKAIVNLVHAYESVAIATLQMEVWTDGRGEILTSERTPEGEGVMRTTRVPSVGFAAFGAWDALRELAHASLDTLIDELQVDFERDTPEYEARNVQRLSQQLVDAQFPELINFLITGKHAPDRIRQIHRLLDDLGLDRPDKKKSKKR